MTGFSEAAGHLIAFITENARFAGPIIGVLAFTESLIVIGMFVPAIPLMVAAGGLIATGALDPVSVLAWAIVGSVLGDWVSYALGRGIGPSVYRRRPLSNHRATVARARLFFRRFGFAAVFLGRFFGPVRATIPLVAGVMQMPQRSFQLANVASAMVWVPAMLAPGYFAGAHLPMQALNGWQALALGAGLLILPFVFAATIARFALKRRPARERRAPR